MRWRVGILWALSGCQATPLPFEADPARDAAVNDASTIDRSAPFDLTPAPDLAKRGAGESCASDGDCEAGLSCRPSRTGALVCLPPPPLTVASIGGPVLSSAKLWTVVWQGDEMVGHQMDRFHDAVFRSDYWSNTVGEYGLGVGKAMGVIVLGPPPKTVSDPDGSLFSNLVASLIGMKTTDGTPVPPPDDQTAFAFIIPAQTDDPDGTYHSETVNSIPSQSGAPIPVPYSIAPQQDLGFISVFDNLTWGDSHELVEMSTDPLPFSNPSWNTLDDGAEVCDLCNDIPVQQQLADGMTYTVTRVFSQQAGAAGDGDPCLPHLPDPFFDISVTPNPIVLPPNIGDKATFTLVPFSYGAEQPVDFQIGSYYGNFDAAPTTGTAKPGAPMQVTITRTMAPIGYPSLMYIWVTPKSNPFTAIPAAEWFGSVEDGM